MLETIIKLLDMNKTDPVTNNPYRQVSRFFNLVIAQNEAKIGLIPTYIVLKDAKGDLTKIFDAGPFINTKDPKGAESFIIAIKQKCRNLVGGECLL